MRRQARLAVQTAVWLLAAAGAFAQPYAGPPAWPATSGAAAPQVPYAGSQFQTFVPVGDYAPHAPAYFVPDAVYHGAPYGTYAPNAPASPSRLAPPPSRFARLSLSEHEDGDESDEDDEDEDDEESDCDEEDEPWTLHDHWTPDCEINYGGWIQIGYHSDNTRLSRTANDQLAYNDRPDRLNLHQGWFYVEKLAEADCAGSDWGYRFDVLYGTDAQKSQAFGNERNVWDVSLDRGSYGWALPQAYLEFASGEWNVKVGHFYSPIGYESVSAPDNFFYSHSLAMFNSEPFTHTGVLATISDDEFLTLYAGWTLGWDTGFDQFGGGSNILAGLGASLSENVEVTYVLSAGNFGFRSADRSGYSHSLVVEITVAEPLDYALQSDYVHTNGFAGDPTFAAEDVGINQYLYYTLNDRVSFGTRVEWWKSNVVTGQSTSFYEVTSGINYQPHANLVIRPEIRRDWTTAQHAAGPGYNSTVFGIDMVLTY